MVVVLKIVFFLIILQLTNTNGNVDAVQDLVAGVANVDGAGDYDYTTNKDKDKDKDDDNATIVGDYDDTTDKDDDEDNATLVDYDDFDTTNKDYVNDDGATGVDSELEETSDKAVYGNSINPDAKVCGGATFEGNKMIALAPDDVWIKKEIQDAKCTAQMEVSCISGIFRSENACRGTSSSVVVTIIGSTGPNGPPIKYPTAANPPTYVLHPDAYYKIASKTHGMINIHKYWITPADTKQGSKVVPRDDDDNATLVGDNDFDTTHNDKDDD